MILSTENLNNGVYAAAEGLHGNRAPRSGKAFSQDLRQMPFKKVARGFERQRKYLRRFASHPTTGHGRQRQHLSHSTPSPLPCDARPVFGDTKINGPPCRRLPHKRSDQARSTSSSSKSDFPH